MDRIAEVLDRALSALQNHGRRVVWHLASWLRVHAHKVQRLPHFLEELIDIQPFFRRDRDAVGDFVEKVKLFDRDCIDLGDRWLRGGTLPYAN